VKLAESWVEDTSTGAALDGFHDEVEEAEDGCGGVVWQPFVLTDSNSNKMLHELAREIRGVEKRRGNKLTTTQYKAIYDNWKSASRHFVRMGHDYFTEFLAKLDCVTFPRGETLQAAFERAKRTEPPSKVLIVPNEGVRLLASLCRELQQMAEEQSIMLHQQSIAKLFGHCHHRNISNTIRALKTLGVLKTAEAAIPEVKAARYFYLD